MTAQTAQTAGKCPVRSYPFSTPPEHDIDPIYAELRKDEPVTRVKMPFGGEAWLVLRQKEARTVYSDPRFSRAATVMKDVPRLRPQIMDDSATLMGMDPPEHSRIRSLITPALTSRRVDNLRPGTIALVNECIDRMTAAGPPADFVEHVAARVPLLVISELLGVGEAEDSKEILRASAEAVNSTSPMGVEERQQAIAIVMDYMRDQVAMRRARPDSYDDLLGALIRVRDEKGDRLSEEELVNLAFGMMSGGQEATMNRIGSMVWLLQQDRSRWEMLVADPDHIPAAVEEMMRFLTRGGAEQARIALEDVELGGVTVRKGDAVLVDIMAVDRDPAMFDDPETLDLNRDPKRHIAFGFGAHHCPGAHLARMELQVTLRVLMERLPRLRIVPGSCEWKLQAINRGITKMLVTW